MRLHISITHIPRKVGRTAWSARIPLDPLFAQVIRPAICARITLLLLIPSLVALGSAAVVDRLALVVGKTAFTQSEVDSEARLTALESGKLLDLSAAQRKQAAERLVDQQLLRDEMQVSGFQTPAAGDGDALVRTFRQLHFASEAAYKAALTRYGVTEDEFKQHLLWEVEVLSFTDQRFKPIAAVTDNQSANRTENGAQPAADSVDHEMESWLKQQRADTRIVFVPEAFQ
jgi:parvulin-like peptidyl-prolyl isomerase